MDKFDIKTFMESLRREAGECDDPEQDKLTLANCFSLESGKFLELAYLSILGRPLDRIGLAEYGKRVHTRMGRAHVICSLMLSPERAGRSFTLNAFANLLRRCARKFRHSGN